MAAKKGAQIAPTGTVNSVPPVSRICKFGANTPISVTAIHMTMIAAVTEVNFGSFRVAPKGVDLWLVRIIGLKAVAGDVNSSASSNRKAALWPSN